MLPGALGCDFVVPFRSHPFFLSVPGALLRKKSWRPCSVETEVERLSNSSRLSKLPLSEWPGWRKGNSNKHAAEFASGMPLVSASSWRKLNPRKDTHASYRGLKPGWPPASPVLCQAQQAVVPTGSMVSWFSHGATICPQWENKFRFYLKPNPQDVSCCYRKDRELQNI